MNVPAFTGGRRLAAISGLAGAAGLLLTLAAALFLDARRALFSYLVAYCWGLGIVLGALILLAVFHAASAKWPVVLRRFVESVPLSLPLYVLGFVPIALGAGRLFPWLGDLGALPRETREALVHRAPYLNLRAFLLRAAVYFFCWILISHLLRAWSVRQDTEGGTVLTRWQRRLGAGALPLLALTMSFASFDWMMSLDAKFYSTIFGLYWFAGSFMGAFAVIAVAGAATRGDRTQFGGWMTIDHFHSVGKFMLAFVAFWAYMAFSQLLLVWIANIPEEVPWYVTRIYHGWAPVFALLAIGKFGVPFFLLLSRDLKRNPALLAGLAGWLLVVQWVDVYWVVMPQLFPEAPRFSAVDVAALVGVAGATVAFTVWRMRGVAPVPVNDPYLHDSLAYEPR